MGQARIEYLTDDKGRVQPVVIGGNGEVQARLEWYDNQSNAARGVADLLKTLTEIQYRPLDELSNA